MVRCFHCRSVFLSDARMGFDAARVQATWWLSGQGRTMLMLVDFPAPLGPSNLQRSDAVSCGCGVAAGMPGERDL